MNEMDTFRSLGMGYIYEPPTVPVRFKVDYLNSASSGVRAEIVAERPNGKGGFLHITQGNVILDGTRSKGDFAGQCLKLSEDNTVPWQGLVEDVCRRVLRAVRQGKPFQMVGRMPPSEKVLPVVDRLLPAFKPTILYGPGGTGKGYIATHIAVCVQTGRRVAGMLEVQQGPVLYLDWEDDPEELDLRVKEVSAGMGLPRVPEIHYRHCDSPLAHQVHQIARYISERGILLVIVDSVEAAMGASSENSRYQDLAKQLFGSIRLLGRVTTLMIDHVSDQARQAKGTQRKVFGSVFKEYLSRNCWELRKDQKAGEGFSHLGLYHTKVNRGMLQQPIGVLLDFSVEGQVKVTPQDVRQSRELASPLAGPDRVLSVLFENGPTTAVALAEELGEKENKVRVWCSRLEKRGLAMKRQDSTWDLTPKGGQRAREKGGEPEDVPEEIPF